jgi:tape measure domain-containing protein
VTGPIDTAYVEIEPRTENFERRATAAFDEVAGVADRVVDAIERSFSNMAEVIDRQFDEMRLGADRNMDALITTVDRVGDDISRDINAGTESAERGFDELRRSADRDLDQVERRSASASASIRGHFGALGASIGIGGIAAAGLSVATAGLGALASFGLKSAASLEQVQIQFNSLLGSAEQGQKVFSDLQKFAAATPFEFPDVAHAAARFLAFDQAVGLSDDQLQQFLTTTGNVIAVTGGGAEALNTVSLAMGQIASTGHLTLDNLNQISEALPGFSAVQAIANATGQTTAEVMDKISKGEIDATTGINALLKGMQQFPGAAGAMEAQSQTLLGVFSTFKDTVSQALAGAFTPVIPAIKNSLTQITPIIGTALSQLAPALGGVLSSVLPLLGQLIQQITPILTPLLQGLSSGLSQIGPVFSTLGAALAPLAESLGPVLSIVGQLLGVLGTALQPILTLVGSTLASIITPAVDGFQRVLEPLTPVLIQLGQALADSLAPLLAALGPEVSKMVEAFIPLTPQLVQLAVAVTQCVVSLAPFIQLVAQLLPYLVTFTTVGAPVIQFLLELATAVVELPRLFGELLTTVGNFGSSVFTAVTGFVSSTASAVGNWISNTWGTVTSFFSQLPDMIGNFIASIPGRIAQGLSNITFAFGYAIGLLVKEWSALPGQVWGIITSLWDTGKALFQAGIDFITGSAQRGANSVGTFMNQLPGRIGGAIIDAWNRGKAYFLDGVNQVSNFAYQLPGRVWGALSQIPGIVQRALSGAASWLYNAGLDIIHGLVNGIEGALSWAIGAAKRAASRIADGFKSALGISSPSTLMEDEVGRPMAQGIGVGFENELGRMSGTLSTLIEPKFTPAPAASTTPTAPDGGFHGTVIVNVGGRQVEGVIMDILYDNPQDVAQAAAQGNRELTRR